MKTREHVTGAGEDHRLKFLLGPHRKHRGRKTVLILACVFLHLIKIHKGYKNKDKLLGPGCEDGTGEKHQEGRASSGSPGKTSDQQSY